MLDPARGNLPAEPPELFGRSGEIAEVRRRLRLKRLVSLVGVAGVGKTSLALAVAHSVRNRYPDGVWLVELAPVGDPESLAPVIAGAFGHQEQPGLTLAESLRRLLAQKELLLVLDNCEHLLEGVASFVEPLLEASHSVDILLTSREGLGTAHEHQLAVAPLPADGVDAPAVQLFAARAAQIVDSFVVGETNSDDVTAICRELDGIPLAIELAATRVRSLSPREIRDRLADRLRLLTGGRRRTERHQSLRHTVRWSYDLLTPGEQALLSRLSIFVGGFTLAAAEAVCAGPAVERDDVIDALDSLVAKSLVVAEVRAGATRYRLLETIRQFAYEELDAAGETEALQRRYAMYFLDTLMGHVVGLGESEHPVGFLWMDAEFDNLRAAFEWMLVGDLEAAAQLCIPMGGFGWRLLRYEAGGWPARVIAARGDPPDEVPADLLGAAIHGPLYGGDLEGARILAERALAAGRRRPPSGEVIEPWSGVMVHAIITGDGQRLLDLVEETRRQPSRARILDDSMWHYVAWAYLLLDDMEASRAAAEEADRQLRRQAYAPDLPAHGQAHEPEAESLGPFDGSFVPRQRARRIWHHPAHRPVSEERDPATGDTLRVGETGEIAVKGETLMRGYYKVDDADVFDDAGWFHTNDAGHLDEDGYLHWSGRMSNVIKSAGANVSPVEIENVLHLWGRLAMTTVVAVDHPTLDQAVVLCAQRLDGDDVSEAEVLDHLRPILARYKLPRRVVFVTDDEVPHTDNDKVKVQALSRLAVARIAAGEDEWATYLRRRT